MSMDTPAAPGGLDVSINPSNNYLEIAHEDGDDPAVELSEHAAIALQKLVKLSDEGHLLPSFDGSRTFSLQQTPATPGETAPLSPLAIEIDHALIEVIGVHDHGILLEKDDLHALCHYLRYKGYRLGAYDIEYIELPGNAKYGSGITVPTLHHGYDEILEAYFIPEGIRSTENEEWVVGKSDL